MKIFNISNGIIHDPSNPIHMDLLASAEAYYQEVDKLDKLDPNYNKKLNDLKLKEAKKRVKIQHDASGGWVGLILRKIIIVSGIVLALYLKEISK